MATTRTIILALLLALGASDVWADHGHCWGGGFRGGFFSVGYGFPACGYVYRPRLFGCYGYPLGGAFCYEAYHPYGIYYSTRCGYADYYLPPVFAPAELLYGPRAVKTFLGIPDAGAPLVVRRPEEEEPVKVRVANAEYRRKAEQLISVGDRLFREQKYQQAIERYKQAAAMAPDMAETYWRRGHAYVATNRYDLAAGTFKRALALNPDVERGGFSLADLYGPASIAKTSHLEALAGEALARGDDPDCYFLLGIFLRYDGQADRAEKFFRCAAELAGADAAHLAGFLPADERALPVAAEGIEL
jgi:tetratricopeptide (TPR) repeat protein